MAGGIRTLLTKTPLVYAPAESPAAAYAAAAVVKGERIK
jgi:hypothetical protein